MALEVIESVRAGRQHIVLKVVDVMEAPEAAIRYGVMTTPAVAINGRLAFTGVPDREALRRLVSPEGPAFAEGG